MEIYKGTTTFAGIAIGKIRYYHRGEYQIRKYLVSNVKKELRDFENARHRVMQALKEMYEQECAGGSAGGSPKGQAEKQKKPGAADPKQLLEQAALLGSGSFLRAVKSMITDEKVNAAYAVMTTKDELAHNFGSLEAPEVKRRIANVSAISDMLTDALGGISPKIDLGREPVILAADSLSPSEIMEMDQEKLLAVVTREGSEISHAAILAKTMAIPCVFGVEPKEEWDGALAIVDGYTGSVYLDPEEEVCKEFEIRRRADREGYEKLLGLRNEADRTIDGREIGIYANIGSLDDLDSIFYYNAKGVGLLRSEFQYFGRENYPDEEELFQAYKKAAITMAERPMVIRTVDLGADKQAAYFDLPKEANPLMGNRGIRFCLDRKEMFKTQLRAIYRASVYGNLAVMYPMITSEGEVDAIDAVTAEVKKELRENAVPYRDIKTGIMIETPAAVMISRELARRVDFLSLGTNDLTQYTLAMDRQNPLLRGKYNDRHPAILRMIKMVIDGAHEENRPVSICGELAADTDFTETFLRMGIDALSVVPACILLVRQALRAVDLSDSTEKKYEEIKNDK